MADNTGYIKLFRKIRDNELWQERRTFSKAEAWLDILMEVRWSEEPGQCLIGYKTLPCGKAESLNSLDTWARRWGWTRSKVKRVLNLFAKRYMIELKSETVTTRIKVCNYEQYQETRNASETQVKRKRNASETQVDTKEESKEEKEVKKVFKNLSASGDAVEGGNGTREYYLTKSKKKLTGKRLETFNQFWEAFDYRKGKAEAADAWLNIPELTDHIVNRQILPAAENEARHRSSLIAQGKTPKYPQGWLSGRRWEDEETCNANDPFGLED